MDTQKLRYMARTQTQTSTSKILGGVVGEADLVGRHSTWLTSGGSGGSWSRPGENLVCGRASLCDNTTVLGWQEIRPKESTKDVKAQNTKMRKPGWELEIDMETTASSTVMYRTDPLEVPEAS